MLRYIASTAILLRVLIMKDVEFCQMLSVPLLILTLLLLKCITLTDQQIWIHPYIPRKNLTWLWCMILSIYCYNQFANILLFLHLYPQGYWPIVFFSCSVLVCFWYQGNAGLVRWICMCSFSSMFWKGWERLVLILQMINGIHQWIHFLLGFFFFFIYSGLFLITDSISPLVIFLFRFFIPNSVL